MRTANETPIFQPRQIAPDAGSRRSGDSKQFFDGSGSGAQQEFDDLFGTAIDGFGHLERDSTLSIAEIWARRGNFSRNNPVFRMNIPLD